MIQANASLVKRLVTRARAPQHAAFGVISFAANRFAFLAAVIASYNSAFLVALILRPGVSLHQRVAVLSARPYHAFLDNSRLYPLFVNTMLSESQHATSSDGSDLVK